MTGSNSHRENIQFFFGRVIFNYSYLIFPKSKTLASLRHAESKHFFGQFLYFKDLLGVSWVWKKLPLMGWLPKPYHWPQVSISPCGLEGADFSEIGEKSHRVGKGQWKITPLSGFVDKMCLYGLMNTCSKNKWVTWHYWTNVLWTDVR